MHHPIFHRLGLDDHPRIQAPEHAPSNAVVVRSPATDQPIAGIVLDDRASYERAAERAVAAFRQWRLVPAPQRGEIVRRIGNAFRTHKDDLGALVTLEMGKILAEGKGEVQECIDIADFAVGLSRQCYGLTMPSERAEHRLMEQWHPLGPVGVITAFNFPIAVWAWNAMLAAVCGDTVIWKPSSITPLIALAATRLVHQIMREQELFKPTGGVDPADVFPLVIGADADVGETMIADPRLPLISATGSCRMGRRVGQVVAGRLGRTLLELGGNNAIVLMPDADMDLAKRAIVFGAVGTAGQRCTTTRRLLCVGDSKQRIVPALLSAYTSVRIGDPMSEGTLMGPLINKRAIEQMAHAVTAALEQGCKVLCGGLPGIERFRNQSGNFVEPTIIDVPRAAGGELYVPPITREETFAPILYVFEVRSLDEAIAIQNDVPHGLSSAIFTADARAAERFISASGSDCGIANVNLGTSGDEIGGAFGGEKETGGGRESGSDSWKAYMRRQTNTINYGSQLPLAQGIRFE